MSQLTDRVARDLREIAAGAQTSPSAWESIVARLGETSDSEVALVLARGQRRPKRPVWIVAAAAAAAVITGTAVLVASVGDDHSVSTDTDGTTTSPDVPLPTATTVQPTVPREAPFDGVWVSAGTDGSSRTMEIVRSGTDDYAVIVHETSSAACAGAAGTVTATGRLEAGEKMVVAQPALTCADGSTPTMETTPGAGLASFTFDRVAGELVDGAGVVWRRSGSSDGTTPPPQPTLPGVGSATSGGMWPQSNTSEVRAAQQAADAGDPAYTWQLFARSAPDDGPWDAPIAARFLEDGLGWEDHRPHGGFAYVEEGGAYAEVVFIRCAPGRTNPLAPLYREIPPEMRGCAPTIDDFTYETVMLSLIQPGRWGPEGIWVVEEWEILQSPSEGPLWWLLYPDLGQVRQVEPPRDDEADAFLEAFLQARVDGHGAEEYLFSEPGVPSTEAPLVYSTTSGVPYDRFAEPQLLQGPVWPTGWREYKVELVAIDATVVEQYFHVVRRGDRLGLVYGYAYDHALQTAENGEPVAVPHSEFGDTVTFIAPPSLPHGDGSEEIQLFGGGTDGRLVLAIDPNPALCHDPPEIGENIRPADAASVARSILALPGIEATEPVPVRIAGTDGLQIDVTSTGRNDCLAPSSWMNDVLADYGDWRMRLYLVDYPESIFPASVLSVTVIAPPDEFDEVQAQATPILETLAFRVR